MLRETPPLRWEQARLLNPLQLAYIGDAVWELLIRARLVQRGLNVRHMHREAVGSVNAGAQARAFGRIRDLLSEEEAEIALRGRNAHPHHGAPKNQAPADYAEATAMECLIGCLYLTGREERMLSLFARSQEE